MGRHAVAGCLPVKIEHRQGVGICCVATMDISPGETILLDTPAVWGPNLKSAPKCLNCLAPWQGFLCPECKFPVCAGYSPHTGVWGTSQDRHQSHLYSWGEVKPS